MFVSCCSTESVGSMVRFQHSCATRWPSTVTAPSSRASSTAVSTSSRSRAMSSQFSEQQRGVQGQIQQRQNTEDVEEDRVGWSRRRTWSGRPGSSSTRLGWPAGRKGQGRSLKRTWTDRSSRTSTCSRNSRNSSSSWPGRNI